MDPLGLAGKAAGTLWTARRDRRRDRAAADRDAAADRRARADLEESLTRLRDVLDRTAGSSDLGRDLDPAGIDRAGDEVLTDLRRARERGLLDGPGRAAVADVVDRSRAAAVSVRSWRQRADELDLPAPGAGRPAERIADAQVRLNRADRDVRDAGRSVDGVLATMRPPGPEAARATAARWSDDRERAPEDPERAVARRAAGGPEPVRLVPGDDADGPGVRGTARVANRRRTTEITEVGTTDAEQAYRAYREAVAREQSLTARAPDAELAAARRETLVRKADLAQARERAARERGSTAPTLTPDARRALVERLDRESAQLRARQQEARDRGDAGEQARLRRERQAIDRQRAELGRGLGSPGRSR